MRASKQIRRRWAIHLLSLLLIISVQPAAAQEEFLTPGSHLKVKGVPPIPTKLVKEIEAYTLSYGPQIAGWHPAKRELWLKTYGAGIRLMRVEEPRTIPRFWQEPGGRSTYDVYFQPQGEYLIYNSDTDGDEMFRMYIFNTKTGESRPLTNVASRSTEFVWSNDGKRIAFSYTLPQQEGVSLALIDPFSPGSLQVVANTHGRYLKAYDWSSNNRLIAYLEFIYSNNSSLWICDTITGERKLLSAPHPRRGTFHDYPKFSKDGRGIYLITDRVSDNHRLAYLDLTTKRWHYLTAAIPRDIDGFEISPDGKQIAFLSNEEGFSKLYLLNTANRQIREVTQIPAGVISNLQWHNNSDDLAFNLSSHDTPNDTYCLTTSTMDLELWFKSRTHGLKNPHFARPELIRWKSFDGRMISGYIYRPPAKFTGPRPVIIDIHGGPASQYRPGFRHVDNYFTNELGIVHIYPNIRGSSGYGRIFLDLDNKLKRRDADKDIISLYKWVSRQPHLDSMRVLLKGRSYGGYVALSVALSNDLPLKGIVSEGASTNLATNQELMPTWAKFLSREEYGDESQPAIRQFMDASAPVNRIQDLSIPLLLIHGTNDSRAPFTEAVQLLAHLVDITTDAWHILAVDEGHSYSNFGTSQYITSAIVVFVIKHLISHQSITSQAKTSQ